MAIGTENPEKQPNPNTMAHCLAAAARGFMREVQKQAVKVCSGGGEGSAGNEGETDQGEKEAEKKEENEKDTVVVCLADFEEIAKKKMAKPDYDYFVNAAGDEVLG